MIDFSPSNIKSWTRLGMRKAFGTIMCEIAKEHDDLIVLVADVADSANLNEFAKEFPNQFYNIGIAEQNMLGIAAGLAKEGNNVFVVSFAPFVSMRAYEVVRTLIGYMHLNVKIIALASGMSLGTQGNTHYCIEDVSLMRSIPGMTVLSPADCVEEAKCLEVLAKIDGPAYLRLTGIDGTPGVYKDDYKYEIGKNVLVKDGDDIAIIATGSIINECVRVSRAMNREDISCAVIDVHTLKPLDKDFVLDLCGKYKLLVTVEEHNIIGGLGTAISDILAEMKVHPPLCKIGIGDEFPHAGNYVDLLDMCGLTALHLKEVIIEKYNNINN